MQARTGATAREAVSLVAAAGNATFPAASRTVSRMQMRLASLALFFLEALARSDRGRGRGRGGRDTETPVPDNTTRRPIHGLLRGRDLTPSTPDGPREAAIGYPDSRCPWTAH